ncbi:MAG: hypothetical protein OHK0022_48790 [Roseiflexaceae bacterium]
MIYLLDSNVCILYMKGSMMLRDRINVLNLEDIALCSIVKAEMFFGAMKSSRPEQTLTVQKEFANRFVSLPFDD